MKVLAGMAMLWSCGFATGQGMTLSPPPEMGRLAVFLGTWTGKFKMTMAGMPETITNATVNEEKFLGGFYHKTVYTLDMPGMGKFEGHVFLGYDAESKTYKSWTFETGTPAPREESGTFDGKKLVMISKPHGGMVTRSTFEIKHTNLMFFTIEVQEGEKWTRVGECEFRRKK